MNLQEALAAALGKKPISSKKEKEEQADDTSKRAEPLTTQQRVARAIVDARRSGATK
jgi:hypothetical protein